MMSDGEDLTDQVHYGGTGAGGEYYSIDRNDVFQCIWIHEGNTLAVTLDDLREIIAHMEKAQVETEIEQIRRVDNGAVVYDANQKENQTTI